VLLVNVVGLADPFQRTVEFASNPLPVMVRTVAVPCTRVLGETRAICGVGLITEKFTAAEPPPPGDGLVTITAATSPAARAAAGSVACREVEFEKIVGTAVPLKLTAEPETNPVPVITTVCAAAPAAALEGDIEATVGTGLLVCCWPVEEDEPELEEQPDKKKTTAQKAEKGPRVRLKSNSQSQPNR
jgi:hypothetical protein